MYETSLIMQEELQLKRETKFRQDLVRYYKSVLQLDIPNEVTGEGLVYILQNMDIPNLTNTNYVADRYSNNDKRYTLEELLERINHKAQQEPKTLYQHFKRLCLMNIDVIFAIGDRRRIVNVETYAHNLLKDYKKTKKKQNKKFKVEIKKLHENGQVKYAEFIQYCRKKYREEKQTAVLDYYRCNPELQKLKKISHELYTEVLGHIVYMQKIDLQDMLVIGYLMREEEEIQKLV